MPGWPRNLARASLVFVGRVALTPAAIKTAKVMILASRTGQWKGIFAEHMSIVMKLAGETSWTRFDVVGWGTPVRENAYAADAYWYGNTPRVIYALEGEAAERLIPAIKSTIQNYPYSASGSLHHLARGQTRIHLCPGWCGIRMDSRQSFRLSPWARIISASGAICARAK